MGPLQFYGAAFVVASVIAASLPCMKIFEDDYDSSRFIPEATESARLNAYFNPSHESSLTIVGLTNDGAELNESVMHD